VSAFFTLAMVSSPPSVCVARASEEG
jgi:hypothetical protein